jgi:hypothetical protein
MPSESYWYFWVEEPMSRLIPPLKLIRYGLVLKFSDAEMPTSSLNLSLCNGLTQEFRHAETRCQASLYASISDLQSIP